MGTNDENDDAQIAHERQLEDAEKDASGEAPAAPPADETPAKPASRTAAATAARQRQAAERRAAADGARKARSMGTAATRKAIAGTVRLVGGLAALADPIDGAHIVNNADTLAEAWAPVFDRHPRLKVALTGIEAGGIYGAAIVATLTVALPILARHNAIPPAAVAAAGMAGMPVPAPGAAPVASWFERDRAEQPEPPADDEAPAPAPADRHPLAGGVHAPPRPNGAA